MGGIVAFEITGVVKEKMTNSGLLTLRSNLRESDSFYGSKVLYFMSPRS